MRKCIFTAEKLCKTCTFRFSTVVRDVVYNNATDDFTVSVKDLVKDEVTKDRMKNENPQHYLQKIRESYFLTYYLVLSTWTKLF